MTDLARKIQQGIISHFFDALCFPEWDPSTNRVTYRLYRRLSEEHITPIERIPEQVVRTKPQGINHVGRPDLATRLEFALTSIVPENHPNMRLRPR